MTEDFKTITDAIRSGFAAQPPVTVKAKAAPFAVAGLVIAVLAPLAGGVGWLMAQSARISVLESKQVQMEQKTSAIEDANKELAALKQELTDFRGEFRDWKRDHGGSFSVDTGGQ